MGPKGDTGSCTNCTLPIVKAHHWVEPLSCKLNINLEAKAVVQPAMAVNATTNKPYKALVSTVIMHGYISTKDKFTSNAPINLGAYSSWWSKGASSDANAAWPAYYPADRVVRCPVASLDGIVSGELLISSGKSSMSMVPPSKDQCDDKPGHKSQYFNLVFYEPCDAGTHFVVDCSWLGGGNYPGYIVGDTASSVTPEIDAAAQVAKYSPSA